MAEQLRAEGIGIRVVSVLDRSQYSPDTTAIMVSLEAGSTAGWTGLVDLAIGIDEHGDSGKGEAVMAHHGFTVEEVAARIRNLLARTR